MSGSSINSSIDKEEFVKLLEGCLYYDYIYIYIHIYQSQPVYSSWWIKQNNPHQNSAYLKYDDFQVKVYFNPTSISCSKYTLSILRVYCAEYTTHNHPQQPTTTHNNPQPPTTTHKHPAKTIATSLNHPQQPKTTCNDPQRPKQLGGPQGTATQWCPMQTRSLHTC